MGSNKTSLTALVGRGVRKEKGLERIRAKLGFCRILYVHLFCCSGIFDSRIPLGVRYPWYPGFPFELRIHITLQNVISLPLPSATTNTGHHFISSGCQAPPPQSSGRACHGLLCLVPPTPCSIFGSASALFSIPSPSGGGQSDVLCLSATRSFPSSSSWSCVCQGRSNR